MKHASIVKVWQTWYIYPACGDLCVCVCGGLNKGHKLSNIRLRGYIYICAV